MEEAGNMDINSISDIFVSQIHQKPQQVRRCAVGIGNQVYIVTCNNANYVFRCSVEKDAYRDTIHWLKALATHDIPVPRIIFYGEYKEYSYIILDYIAGEDIGLIYPNLTKKEKREIAKEVIRIQEKVAHIELYDIDDTWSWYDFLEEMLGRSYSRIKQNGYFDSNKVEKIKSQMSLLDDYFSNVKPIAYLDDISTKNLLINNGKLSGIIDVDWMGVGDNLTFIALTYVALLNMECKTDYVDYLLEERGCTDSEQKAFLFYSLLFCVDLMGERGMQFGDKKIEVDETIVNRLNRIYDDLWGQWCKYCY